MYYNHILIALLLVYSFTGSLAFFVPMTSSHSHLKLSMIFGKAAAKPTNQKIVITVDNKVIESSQPCNLRKVLLDNKVDVYPLVAKVTGNCGGAGICGTCAVKVISGMENFNAPSKNEQKTLSEKKKPSDQRLSCCSRISGPVTIKTKP